MNRSRRSIRLFVWAAFLPLVACTAPGSYLLLDADQVGSTLRQRGLDPRQVILPFGLTDEMKTWVSELAPPTATPRERLEALRLRLLDAEQMSLEYQWGYTGTAIEVFEQRRANCLAFTNLFVSMARELGVPVYFLAVEDTESFRKYGDLIVVSDHIAVGYGPQTARTIYDFSAEPVDDYRLVRRLSDLTVIAMFHSNRGAEALQAGQIRPAIRWLRTAVTIDPELVSAWVNLGVALRRADDLEGAEMAYKRALELDPRVYSAYQNLAALLRLQERVAEAEDVEAVLSNSPTHNPFTYLALGDLSLRAGEIEQAERFYRRAIGLADSNAECFAALGQLAYATGDLRTARRMLKKAQKIDPQQDRARRLAAMLEDGTSRTS